MSRRVIASNLFALYAVQGLQYIFPLLTLPVLTRAVGQDGYGALAFWQSLASLLGLVVDYGFGYTSVRAISQGGAAVHSRVFWSTTWAKVILLVPGTVLLAAFASWSAHSSDPAVAAMAWLPLLGAALSPAWFYIALKRNMPLALCSVSAAVLALLFTLVFVRTPADFHAAAAIQFCMPLGASLLMLAWLPRTARVGRPCLEIRHVLDRFREGFPLFMMTVGAGAYSSFNPFLLGLVSTAPQVADFSLAERVVRAAKNATGPLLAVMYPYAAESASEPDASRRGLRQAAWAVLALSALIALAVAALAPLAIDVLGGRGFKEAVGVTRILAGNILVITAGNLVGVQYLVARGREQAVTRITVAAAPLHIVTLLWAGSRYGAPGAASAHLISESLVTVALVLSAIYMRKKQ
jgi:polysaccharide transporter, PST family